MVASYTTAVPPARSVFAAAQAHAAQVEQSLTTPAMLRASHEEVEAFESAADTCREQRSADADAFMAEWGTNAPRGENNRGAKKNAFGKCVSKTAKELHGEDAPTA